MYNCQDCCEINIKFWCSSLKLIILLVIWISQTEAYILFFPVFKCRRKYNIFFCFRHYKHISCLPFECDISWLC